MPRTLRRLTRESLATGAGYAVVTLGLYAALLRVWEPAYASRWMALALGVLAYVVWTLNRHLAGNHRPDGHMLYRTLGVANHLSVLRGVLLAWLAGFIFSPRPEGWLGWVPGVLYTTAAVIDYVDGLAARLTKHPSALGVALDLEFDALGILIAPALGIWWGQLPVWYASVAVAYYAFVFGKWIRQRRGQPVYPLPPSAIRRPMAGIQMGFISAVLWPLFDAAMTRAMSTLVMVPFVAGFARDWLVVSGWIDASSGNYRRWMQRVSRVAQGWLPVLLRMVVAGTFVSLVILMGRIGLYSEMSLPASVWIIALVVLVLMGWMGRLGGTLLAIFVGVAAARFGVTLASGILVGCGLGLMLFGTGSLSLWQPEDDFLRRHYGGGD